MKPTLVLSIFLAFAVVSQAAPMDKRRFGVEHTPEADATFQEVKDIAQGTDKEAQAGNLSGAMVRSLLAKAPACDQQDRADEVIDLGRQLGGDKEKQMIKVAQTFRQLERNTPKAGQPSELCKKPPKNKELNGLVQAQDPTGKGNAPPATDPNAPPATDPNAPPATDPNAPPATDPNAPPATDPNASPATGANAAETNPVGGVKMPKIVKQNGDFLVNGVGFNGNLDAAHGRQCDVQHNLCFNKFNSGDRSFSGQDCDNQTNVCKDGPPVFA